MKQSGEKCADPHWSVASGISGRFWGRTVSDGHFWPLTLLSFSVIYCTWRNYFSQLLPCILLLLLVSFILKRMNWILQSLPRSSELFLTPLWSPNTWHGSGSEERRLVVMHRCVCLLLLCWNQWSHAVEVAGATQKVHSSGPVFSPWPHQIISWVFFTSATRWNSSAQRQNGADHIPMVLASLLQIVLICYPSCLLDVFLLST